MDSRPERVAEAAGARKSRLVQEPKRWWPQDRVAADSARQDRASTEPASLFPCVRPGSGAGAPCRDPKGSSACCPAGHVGPVPERQLDRARPFRTLACAERDDDRAARVAAWRGLAGGNRRNSAMRGRPRANCGAPELQQLVLNAGNNRRGQNRLRDFVAGRRDDGFVCPCARTGLAARSTCCPGSPRRWR
jgi:hypothetical protein